MWLGIGVVAGLLGLWLLVLVIDTLDSKQLHERVRLDQERRSAEHRLESITQAAMTEMLTIARRYQ